MLFPILWPVGPTKTCFMSGRTRIPGSFLDGRSSSETLFLLGESERLRCLPLDSSPLLTGLALRLITFHFFKVSNFLRLAKLKLS